MNRRLFMNKALEWGKKAALASLFTMTMGIKTTWPRNEETSGGALQGELSLQEFARNKMHHDGNGFINPFSTKQYGKPWPLLYWKLFSKNHFKSLYDQEHVVPVSMDWRPIHAHRGLSVSFIKHACVMIKDGDQYILVDPVLFNIFNFIKDFTPLAFDLTAMPPPDHILVTHGHYDHLDTRSLSFFDKRTHVITPLGYDSIFEELNMTNRTQLDWFDGFADSQRHIMLLPCNHWTMRNPLVGPNKSLWGSFLIKSESGPTIFIGGDTGYFDGYKELGRDFSIDLAIFNLGAYEPRWFMAQSHMNPAETVRAFRELNAARLLVVHWGTFRLGDEPVYLPPLEIKREMQKYGLLDRLVHLNHGQSLFYTPERDWRIV